MGCRIYSVSLVRLTLWTSLTFFAVDIQHAAHDLSVSRRDRAVDSVVRRIATSDLTSSEAVLVLAEFGRVPTTGTRGISPLTRRSHAADRVNPLRASGLRHADQEGIGRLQALSRAHPEVGELGARPLPATPRAGPARRGRKVTEKSALSRTSFIVLQHSPKVRVAELSEHATRSGISGSPAPGARKYASGG